MIESEGARYIRTETNGVWSRSRALNAGLQVASGDILVTTDADMVFTPETFNLVVASFERDANQYIVMQCNDLPAGISHQDIENERYEWPELSRIATQRPRWGMGGMIAVPRAAYLSIRGLDERMEIYGGEDIDFARRMRRLGLKLTWLTDPAARMFHVWHPSSRDSANATAAGRNAIKKNREIQANDKSVARNLKTWIHAPMTRPPLVSVVISTFNRAEYLKYAILSVLGQTFRDFELIIIDDGSTDDTADVVKSFNDSRIIYEYQQNSGLAAARNRATHKAQGRFIAVMDDDDLMLPDRLENELNAVKDGANGSYGGWIDFDESTGERKFYTGKALSLESILFNSATYLHPTLLVERAWMLAVPYDESLRSGSDYNMAIRMIRSGIKLAHSGKYVLMRRRHPGQITELDTGIQKSAGAITSMWGRSTFSTADMAVAREERSAKDKVPIQAQRVVEPRVLEYLPDATVERRALVRIRNVEHNNAIQHSLSTRSTSQNTLWHVNGPLVEAEFVLDNVSLDELLHWRATEGLDVLVETIVRNQQAQMKGAEPIRIAAVGTDSPEVALSSRLSAYYSGVHSDQLDIKLILFVGNPSDIHVLGSSSEVEIDQFIWRAHDYEIGVGVVVVPVDEEPVELALRVRDAADGLKGLRARITSVVRTNE